MRSIKFRSWNGKNFEYFNNGKCDCAFGWGEAQQFTGLVDKQGVEIYEGDIVKDASDGYLYEIAFVDAQWRVFRQAGAMENGWLLCTYFSEKYKLEVIGNIYQNAELLE